MRVHRSNRVELLVDELAELVRAPLANPLAAECIVVQGRGMERWLTMELSSRHGVWANPKFPFLRALIDECVSTLLGEQTGKNWDASFLRWAVARYLVDERGSDALGPLATYLSEDAGARKLLPLAERVAAVFDDYAIYRPSWLESWKRGERVAVLSGEAQREHESWQLAMWRALAEEHGLDQLAALRPALERALAAGEGLEDLPQRISVFGVSTLPPLYLDLLQLLSRYLEVHLFILSPSMEYWADIRRQKDILRQELRTPGAGTELLLEEGHPLLASLGTLQRDFQCLLESRVEYSEGPDLYREPEDEGQLLSTLQRDILHLQSRGPLARSSKIEPALPWQPSDRSVRIHSCHSPMREMEVLRDQIIEALESDPKLEARDVVVMTPDIEAYAPFIDAVFRDRNDGSMQLPFHIADRPPRATYQLIDAFVQFASLCASRLTAPELVDFVSRDPVRESQGIELDELATIRHWVQELNIGWGRDAHHRGKERQPELEANTWRWGLRRLLTGCATTSEAGTVGEILPYDDMEGGDTELLGRFAELCERFFDYHEEASRARSVDEWCHFFEDALSTLFARDDDNAREHQMIRDSLQTTREAVQRAGFEETVSLSAMSSILSGEWDQLQARSNFLRGGITFCQLMPMRSIPFQLLCLVGMNDGAYPRQSRDQSFDLSAAKPERGDRSPRDDDRYLFLEAILSARQRLIITYTGQDLRQKVELPPSVLVGELLDVLDDSFDADKGRPLREHIVVQHPLHPFSPRYFDGSHGELFSYSQLYRQGAQSLRDERDERPAFLGQALEPKGDESDVIALSQLVAFFRSPAKYLATRRLGLSMDTGDEELLDREPVELDPLSRYQVADQLLEKLDGEEAGTDELEVERLLARIKAQGQVPLGAPGQAMLDELLPEVRGVVSRASAHRGGDALPAQRIDIDVGDGRAPVKLVGELDHLWPSGRQLTRFSKPGGKIELQLWIEHLALCSSLCDSTPCDSTPCETRSSAFFGRLDKKVHGAHFGEVSDPIHHLQRLVDLYRRGHERALPFFPDSSRAYAQGYLAAQGESGSDPHVAGCQAAQAEMERRDQGDAYNRLLHDQAPELYTDPEAEASVAFGEVALLVYGPMLDHREELIS